MSFKDKYFCYCGNHVAYGKVADQFDGVLLLRLDSCSDPLNRGNLIATPVEVVFETFDSEYFAQWMFFETEEKMQKYRDHLDDICEDKTPKIVSIKK
jgi:hypothetical protein